MPSLRIRLIGSDDQVVSLMNALRPLCGVIRVKEVTELAAPAESGTYRAVDRADDASLAMHAIEVQAADHRGAERVIARADRYCEEAGMVLDYVAEF